MTIPQAELFSVLAGYKLLQLLNSYDYDETKQYLREPELTDLTIVIHRCAV